MKNKSPILHSPVLPASASDIGSMMALAMNVIWKKPEPGKKA